MKRDSNALTTHQPHPDHFDPTKFGPDGLKVRRAKGRPSRITCAQVEQIVGLDLVARTAERDLVDYLIGLGYVSKARRAMVLKRVREGWRPTR